MISLLLDFIVFLDIFEIFTEDCFLLRSFRKFLPSGFLPLSRFQMMRRSGEVRAGSQVSKITDPDEPGKRRRQSKSKRAKKAAKVKRQEHSPRASLPPEEEESEDEQGGFEGFQGFIPDLEVRSAFAEMTRLNKGYKAQSESARSAASRISELMLQMGQEHVKLEEARRNEKGLM